MSKMRIGLVYLGKKGAAENHLLLINQLKHSKVELRVVVSNQNQKLQEYKNSGIKLFIIDSPMSIKSLIHLIFGKKFLRTVTQFFSECDTVYFYLPHPLDNHIARALLKRNFRVIRSIHDHKLHPGDKWPTKMSLTRQIRFTSELIVHSHFVAKKIGSRARPIVLPLPVPKRAISEKSAVKTVLFVGRFKRYKGINKLLKSWPKVLEIFPDAELILAGVGALKKTHYYRNVTIINRWLSPEEIERLIDSSSCIVFPYTQASQSGPLSLAISAFKPVVITGVGGLPEQASHGCHYEVSYTTEGISSGIIAALTAVVEIRSETIENRELADYLMELSKVGPRNEN